MEALLIPPLSVRADQVEALVAIAEKPQGSYAGYERLYVTPDGRQFSVDTRYDDDLRIACLLERK